MKLQQETDEANHNSCIWTRALTKPEAASSRENRWDSHAPFSCLRTHENVVEASLPDMQHEATGKLGCLSLCLAAPCRRRGCCCGCDWAWPLVSRSHWERSGSAATATINQAMASPAAHAPRHSSSPPRPAPLPRRTWGPRPGSPERPRLGLGTPRRAEPRQPGGIGGHWGRWSPG